MDFAAQSNLLAAIISIALGLSVLLRRARPRVLTLYGIFATSVGSFYALRFFELLLPYSQINEGLAAALDDFDDRLDDLQVEMVESIFASHAAGTIELREAVQLAMMCRFYERIGDHAVNMGERVVYLVSGWLPEHVAVARAEMKERSGHGLVPPDEPAGE